MSPVDTNLILHRLDEQDKALGRIETHVAQTNGRVLALERWQARVLGAVGVLTVIGVPAALAALFS